MKNSSMKLTAISVAMASALLLSSASASAALVTYTAQMTGFTYNSDTVSAGFNAALGIPYTHLSFNGASNTDGASYSSLATFSTKTGAFGGSNTSLVNADNEIGPFDTWDGILNINFNNAYVSAVGFGLVVFNDIAETIRIYDDNDALIGTFNNQLLGETFSFWGVVADAGEKIGRIELDGNFFAIQDIAFSETSSTGVPEPATMLLLGAGLLGLGLQRRRKI